MLRLSTAWAGVAFSVAISAFLFVDWARAIFCLACWSALVCALVSCATCNAPLALATYAFGCWLLAGCGRLS